MRGIFMSTFRDKKYWILLVPFLTTAVLMALYLPPNEKPLTVLVILLFWATYYLWGYLEKRTGKRDSK